MRLTHIANAGCWYDAGGFRLLADPWVVDGAFEGSWCHFPPLRTKPEDLAGAQILYISHLHPDHLNPPSLTHVRRDIPVVVLDHGANYLHRMLRDEGFTNLVRVKDGESVSLGPFRLTMFAPFCSHPFHESIIGNAIDSALVIQADGQTVLNCNDNNPSVEAARMLRQMFGRIDVAQLPYNAAGPYPACFAMPDDRRRAEADRIVERNLLHMVAVADTLGAQRIQPFAGEYMLGGSLFRKNEQLALCPIREARKLLDERALVLDEGGDFDIGAEGGGVVPGGPVFGDLDAIKSRRYPYEDDPMPSIADLSRLLGAATDRLHRAMADHGIEFDLLVVIADAGGDLAAISCRQDQSVAPRNTIRCTLDPRLLHRILTRQTNWNNAETGCHIEFDRRPDVYLPDWHTLMAHFHA